MSAVCPFQLSVALTEAPASISSCSTSPRPVRAAIISGVSPPGLAVSGVAPPASRASTIATLPLVDASASGVTP